MNDSDWSDDEQLADFRELARRCREEEEVEPTKVFAWLAERSPAFLSASQTAGSRRLVGLRSVPIYDWLEYLRGEYFRPGFDPVIPVPRPGVVIDADMRSRKDAIQRILLGGDAEFSRAYMAAPWTARWAIVERTLKPSTQSDRDQWLVALQTARNTGTEDQTVTRYRHFTEQFGPSGSHWATQKMWERFERLDGKEGRFDRMLPPSWVSQPWHNVYCGETLKEKPSDRCSYLVARSYVLPKCKHGCGASNCNQCSTASAALVVRARYGKETRYISAWLHEQSAEFPFIRLTHGPVWQHMHGAFGCANVKDVVFGRCEHHGDRGFGAGTLRAMVSEARETGSFGSDDGIENLQISPS